MKATAPGDTLAQLSGAEEDGTPVLSVVVKRTYTVDDRGECHLAKEQLPLEPLTIDPEEPERVVTESDVYPLKPLTDVVVRGHAYPPEGEARFVARVSVGPLTKELVVVGDRRVAKNAKGAIVFSSPAAFDKMPLRYDLAYGGHDKVAEARYGNPYKAMKDYLQPPADKSRHSPYRYMRNGIGKGFVLDDTPESIESIELPNLEDPSDLLSPTRLFVGSPRRWAEMPLPWCTDWASLGAFPRFAYLGGWPDYEPIPGEIAEVKRAFMSKGYPKPPPRDPRDGVSLRVFNGGSHGLQLGPFGGDALDVLRFQLTHMHPKKRQWSFRLPSGAPAISVDGRNGKLLATTPVLHHVVIEPDHDRVTVLWRGSARALRRYSIDELAEMPLLVEW